MREILQSYVDSGAIPGAVGLVARGDEVEVEAVGWVDAEHSAPMARDSIFRIASITKPIAAAAVLLLIEDGRVDLHDAVDPWLPELAGPRVVRTPGSALDDVLPANRSITVHDLLTSCAGYGFPSDFALPVAQAISQRLQRDGREPQAFPPTDEWIAQLGAIPLLYQPGEQWLYNTCSDLQGVLVGRVAGQSFPDFLAERIFRPLGMVDTGFDVPPEKMGRFTSYYRLDDDGALALADPPGGQWATQPPFPSGAGGLVSTVDDYLAFARAILTGGLLGEDSVRAMTSDQLRPEQRAAGGLFLDGQSWGFGGSVDIDPVDPWNVPGRYGWVGGTGTAAYLTPSTGTVTILLMQLDVTTPTPTAVMRDFWRYAGG